MRGIGGFGGKALLADEIPKQPTGKPTATREVITYKNAALLYRLAGDFNPLHADPSMAAMGGFDRPIIHGLCSAGICAKAVYDEYCDNDPENFKEFNVRFTSHAFPGETYIIDMFKEGSKVVFAGRTKERTKVVALGYVIVGESAKLWLNINNLCWLW